MKQVTQFALESMEDHNCKLCFVSGYEEGFEKAIKEMKSKMNEYPAEFDEIFKKYFWEILA